MISIIVAMDNRNGIGKDNKLPWHLPSDLAHFKRTTLGHPIIMGRKTFESIGRPLPGRLNIVLTRAVPGEQVKGADVYASSLEAALEVAKGLDVFIIGGAEVYKQALPLADRLIVTHVDGEFDCDAFFPAIQLEEWQEVSHEEHATALGLEYAIATYKRRT